MNTDKERQIAHYQKYLAYAEKMGVSFAESPLLPEVIEAVQAGDLNLNSIRLRRWDAYDYRRLARGLESGGWSLSNTVCTAKAAALASALSVILHIPTPQDGESLVAALESL